MIEPPRCPILLFVGWLVLTFIYLERETERERVHACAQGRDRERIPCRLRAVTTETHLGLDPTDHLTQNPESDLLLGRTLNPLTCVLLS